MDKAYEMNATEDLNLHESDTFRKMAPKAFFACPHRRPFLFPRNILGSM
jgi:hypothetical protein